LRFIAIKFIANSGKLASCGVPSRSCRKSFKAAPPRANTPSARGVYFDRKYCIMANNTHEESDMPKKKGLWYNIDQKRKRIKAGSGEKMRKAGSKGAPTAKAFKAAAKTAKKKTAKKKAKK
jgi:hypothetical protein